MEMPSEPQQLVDPANVHFRNAPNRHGDFSRDAEDSPLTKLALSTAVEKRNLILRDYL
jgi:hypothetical protein